MTNLNESLGNLYESYQAGEFVKAEIGVRELLKTQAENPDVLRLGALTAMGVNQVATADERLVKAASLTPMTAEMSNTRGNILRAAGDWAGAKDSYELARKIDPSYPLTDVGLLNMYLQSGQAREALNLLDTGRDLGEMGRYARIQALVDIGKHEQALVQLDTDWSNANRHHIDLLRLKVWAGLGRLEELKQTFDDIADDSIFMPQALGIVVNTLEIRGLRSEALDIIAQTTASDHAIAAIFVKASQLLRRMDQPKASSAVLETAQSRFGKQADILGEAGRIAFHDKDPEKSVQLYLEALRLRPGDMSLLSGYMQAALQVGDFGSAQQILQGALDQAPNNQFLYAMGATLQRATGGNYRALYDYDAFVRSYELETPKGYDDMPSFNKALKEALDRLHVNDGTPIDQSLRHGTQTEVDLSLIEDPVIKSFFEAVDKPIRDYIDSLPDNPDHPLGRRKREAYRIAGAWSVRLSDKGHHVNHVHPLGWLSSSYYVDVPSSLDAASKEGWIKFGEPSFDMPNQGPEKFIQPKPGLLVLFPSYMWHGTVPFTGNETRLTLPFDVVPA